MRKIIIINPSSKASCLGAGANKSKPKQRSRIMSTRTRRRRRRRSARSNSWYNASGAHSRAARLGHRRRKRSTRRNPRRRVMRRTHARRRSYRRRRNPARAFRLPTVRRMFGGPALTRSLAIVAGFVGGFTIPPMILDQFPIANATTKEWIGRLKGLASVLLGTMLATGGKRALTKDVGTGFVVAGFYDLLAMNVPQLPLPTITPKPLLGHDHGPGITPDMGAGFAPGQQADVIGAGISQYADADVVGEDLDIDDIV